MRPIGRLTASALMLVALTGAALWLAAALVAVSEVPNALHAWLPLPVACAGARCVTFRGWAALIRNAGEAPTPEEPATLLTALLTSRAADVVARRSGLGVSGEEVRAAAAAVNELGSTDPALQEFLRQQTADAESASEGMRELLVRKKLAAAGTPDIWASPLAPRVFIFHLRYRWDPIAHRVVAR